MIFLALIETAVQPLDWTSTVEDILCDDTKDMRIEKITEMYEVKYLIEINMAKFEGRCMKKGK